MTSKDFVDELLGKNFVPQSAEDWHTLDSVARTLFRPTAPVDEDKLFVGRIKQIGDLLDVIYQAGAHAIIYGERGVGKTSLCNIIHQRIIGPSRYTKVLKISCSPNDTFDSIWGNVFFDFNYEGKSVGDVVKRSPQPFTIFKVAEVLPDTARYLVILDEFDRIRDSETKTLIADTIKYFSDTPLKLTILVVGVGSSIETLFGSHPSIQRCCQQIPMPRMSRTELEQIVHERLPQLHMEIDLQILNKMVQFSQGLPGYMHLLGLLATRSALGDQTQRIQHRHLSKAVSGALDKADESTRREYFKAIQSTKPDNRYKEVLLACALSEKNELGQFSATDVCEPYSRIMGKPMKLESFARHLNAFCDLDRGPALVKSGKPKRFMYCFNNPLLEPLVVMRGDGLGHSEGATSGELFPNG